MAKRTINRLYLAKLPICKGRIGQTQVLLWDYVGPCSGDKCPVSKDCPYGREHRCGLERYFLGAVLKPFFELAYKYENSPDPFVMQWIGIHIIPLYRILARLYKEELMLERPVVGKKVHPIYGEIRTTIEAIRKEWNQSGLVDLAKGFGYLKGVPSPGKKYKGVGRPKEKPERKEVKKDDWYADMIGDNSDTELFDEYADEILERTKRGDSIADISADYDTTPSALRKWLEGRR